MKLEIRHVRLLLALVEERSIRRTAQRLGLPQPALSSQLSRIEETLGRKLFQRSTRGVVLTEDGARLLHHLHAVDAGMKALEREIMEARKDPPDVMRVGVSWSGLLGYLEHELAAAKRAAQFVLVEEHEGPAASARGVLDFLEVMEASDSPLKFPHRFRTATVAEVPIGVIVPSGHPLSGHGQITGEDLARAGWVSALPDTWWHQKLMDFCAIVGFVPNIQYLTASQSTLPELLAARPTLAVGSAVHAAAVGGRLLRFGWKDGQRVVAAWDPATCPDDVARDLLSLVRSWYGSQVPPAGS
ncbi:LysR family transcriptional regulator [Planomonospora sp. ID82291]|uniref:LysR family transcriptional regulator n=1 Tax=Planomonospora sp. ID82291 TaxID=2738136 RepID=UPI0018C38C88|nr:LysR family transcriptional regulator [Planomonospora sp. ID82291]MBG0814613.1 LysR family transcriptional regulator [Planomonospora sp. ID82291]